MNGPACVFVPMRKGETARIRREKVRGTGRDGGVGEGGKIIHLKAKKISTHRRLGAS